MPSSAGPADRFLPMPDAHDRGPERAHRASSRHQAHTRRAILNAAPFSLALVLLSACAKETSHGSSATVGTATARASAATPAAAPAPSTPEARVQQLVTALVPLEKTVTSDLSDAHFVEGQRLQAELAKEGRPVGLAALEALRSLRQRQKIEGAERILAVERGLLGVAARAAPLDTRELLHNLTTQYGAALDLRTEAVLLYAETSPAQALEVLGPLVVQKRAESTLPPAEFLVVAYVTACEKTGNSPVEGLATVATNLFQEGAARVRAVKELGKHKEPRALQALQAILVESTGDGYLRRMAVQSLLQSLPAESACEILYRVADKEADLNFLQFLGDVIEKNCAK
jgi:hypothetical protein